MLSGSPIPPISVIWSRYRDPDADGWKTPYTDRIKEFEELMGNDVATKEIFTDNEDEEEVGNEEEEVAGEDEETVGNENKDGYHDNGAVAKECSKDSMIPNTTYS